jgi:transposase-like protein
VLDGSKALRRAIGAMFGKRALVKRCQVHKSRNILSYLPPGRHAEARRRLKAAWGLTSFEEALRELRKVQRWLDGISESAGDSLDEALEQTITVHCLGICGALRRTLVTTNPIESAIEVVKHNARRVKRWRGAAMVLRWVGSGLVTAEASFRRVKGHAAMPQLVAALESSSLPEDRGAA